MKGSGDKMLFYLVTLFLCISSVSCCPSFTSSVEEGCPGEELTYTCNIFQTGGTPIARWSGFCADSSDLTIVHGVMSMESDDCGPFMVNATGSDGGCHTSTLTVTVSPELSGRVIRCSHLGVEVGRATLLVADNSSFDLNVYPTYDETQLVNIRSSWNGICSLAMTYTITYVYGANSNSVDVPGCPGCRLVHDFDDFSSMPSDVSVSVSVAGLMSRDRTVSANKTNVLVDVAASGSPTTVSCTFPEGYPGKARCGVEFVYDDQDTVSVSSSNCIGDGEVDVPLNVYLPPNRTFTYTAFAVGDGCPGFVQPISASGSGTTGPYDNCLENLLLRSDIGDCEDGKSMNVTFNDLTPGSTAVYQCCSGYMLIGNDATQLTCQPDGNWDRTPPVCVEIPPTCPSCPGCGCPEYVNWIAIALGVVMLVPIALFIIFLVLYCIEKKNNKAHPDDAREFASSSPPDSKPTTQF